VSPATLNTYGAVVKSFSEPVAVRFGVTCVDDMRKALRLKRKPTSSKPVPAEDVALADVYREVLKGQFPQASHVQLVVRNEKGTSVLDFKSVPLAEVGTLILALMDHLPPGSDLRRGEKAPPPA
jgi:hypothetical protein